MRIAFAGNPNSGKTTMYNALTGRNEKVGNWAGVTIDRKESKIKKAYYQGSEELIAVDLPGAYSMSPFTSEESITSSYVKNEHPDAIVNIVDATNLSRSLFFTTQLLELDVPVVVALNKSDINRKKGTEINIELLAKEKPVVASFSSVAASGAYWIATAADNIFLMPETITGSIGVFSIAFSVEKFAGGYGVDFDGVKTSPFADIGTLTRPMGERELALTGKMVREVYDRFVDLVCKSRKISPAELAEIADGRIFDGATAVRLNLADGFGTLDEVVAALMEKCECDGVKEYPKIDRFKEFMKSFSAAEPFAKSVPPKLKAYLDSIKSLSAYSDKRGIYARIPFDIALK